MRHMYGLLRIFIMGLVLVFVGCAASQKKTDDSADGKRCRMEMRVGSRIPEEICTSTEEEAQRHEEERKRANRAIRKPGSMNPAGGKTGG